MIKMTEHEREAYLRGHDDGYLSGVDNTLDEIMATIVDYLEEIHPPHDKLTPCIRCDYVAVIRVLQDRILKLYEKTN